MINNRMMHGGDYNPEQWIKYPEMIEKDFEAFKKANINTITVGMFSWSMLEPEEDKFEFDWLDRIFELAQTNNINVILGTPSGARPNWLAQKYPDVLRTNEKREKMLFGGRHNHCFTSPNYRDRVTKIDSKLAERYGNHPSLVMWHISNEFSGECHCDLCQRAFRQWLKNKYETLENINEAYWSTFWSHRYTNWNQVESPSSIGEQGVHALNLDWRRFVTEQTIDFYKTEVNAIKKFSTDIPVTTNFMADTADLWPFQALNYSKFAKEIDVISWDSYPAWHNDWSEDFEIAMKVGFINDLYRSLKKQPFLLMESTPSFVNWHDINRPKKPGFHPLSGHQYVAHGSNSVLYFQLHQSRGSSEKFHGAVVGVNGDTDTRVFNEVSDLGHSLTNYDSIIHTMNQSDVAIMYDWENDWILKDIQGFSIKNMNYIETIHNHYSYFWENDISVDVITPDESNWDYKLVIIPMLYMMDEDMLQQIEKYVSQGGKVVLTYMTGIVDKNDLIHDTDFQERIENLVGSSLLEMDILYPKQRHQLLYKGQTFEVKDYCGVIENNKSEVIANYQSSYLKNKAAIVKNQYGDGQVFYIAARTDKEMLHYFYKDLVEEIGLNDTVIKNSNKEVSIQRRSDDDYDYYFIMNFSEEEKDVYLNEKMKNLNSNVEKTGTITLSGYEVKVLQRHRLRGEL